MIPSKWFAIINPKAGNRSALKQWPKIESQLISKGFNFEFAFIEYVGHATKLVINAADKGFRNIICIGGDGTLHAVVNGLMVQKVVKSSAICIGVIPIGTGNDWAKTYAIPNKTIEAIQLIKKNITKIQDVGQIEFLDSKKPSVYFNNLAGIGFDGLVAKRTEKLKHLGKFSYLIAACQTLLTFKNFKVEILYKNNRYTTKSFMVLVGLCTYSGGGMRLTKTPNPEDGMFDIANVTNFNAWNFITSLTKLYNGKAHTIKKVETFKTDSILIRSNNYSNNLYIQADGEILEAENISITIKENAFSFYC